MPRRSPTVRSLLTTTVLLASVTGCGLLRSDWISAKEERSWLADGVIALSRPVPSAETEATGVAPILGFAPSSVPGTAAFLTLDRAERELLIMDGASIVQRISGLGMENVPAGSYKVVHKQRAPLWYAPDSYFTARSMPTPPKNHPDRYRRGALGQFALFLDKDVAIHSGPLWSDDVGGIRLSEEDLAKMYYAVAVGASLEVR